MVCSMISIIIPAYNEENVIARCLEPLLPGTKNNELEIIVVCNGCTDKTANIIRKFKEHVQIIETQIPSKTNALNLGDEVASGFPRFYLDADVVISLEAVRKVAEVLDSGCYLAAAPQVNMNYNHSSWSVRSYYDVWLELPYVRDGMIGTGVYALSEEGRAKFDQFPDIIADDGYARSHFTDKEKYSVPDCYAEVTAPLTIKDLIKIKTRSRLGGYELWQKFPLLKKREQQEKAYGKALLQLIPKKTLLLKLPAYLYVNTVSRIKAMEYFKAHKIKGWERDHSSRTQINIQ